MASRAELERRVEQLEDAVAWLRLGKKQQAEMPPPRFFILNGFRKRWTRG